MMIKTSIQLQKKLVRVLFYEIGDLEGKKKINYDKASLRMMLQPQSIKLDIDALKESKQFHIYTACKIFFSKGSHVPLGEMATLNIDGKFSPLQLPGSFQKILDSFGAFWEDENIDRHFLHDPNKLRNYLLLSTKLQQNSKWTFSRFLLTFLAYYIRQSTLIKTRQAEKIIEYLFERNYSTNHILSYINQNLENKPASETNIQKKVQNFEIICTRIKILNHIINSQDNRDINSKQIQIKESRNLLEMYAEEFFQYFQDPEIIQEIYAIDTQVWVIDVLFSPKYQKKMYQNLQKLFDPLILYKINYHSTFFQVLFDKIYLYSSFEQADEIIQLLEKFKEYVSLFSSGISINIGPSLIFLCKKFEFTSRTLSRFFYNNYLREKFLYKSLIQPQTIKKNRNSNKNLLMGACHCLAVCQEVSGQINPYWRSIFIDKLQNALELSLYQFPGIDGYLFQANIQNTRDTASGSDFSRTFFRITGQLYFDETPEIRESIMTLEKSMDAHYDPRNLQNFTYPIDSKINDASRINVLFWNLYYYAEFNSQKQKTREIYESINSNTKIIKHIQNNFAYPKVFQALIKYSNSVWNANPKNSNRNANLIGGIITQQKIRFNTIFSEKVQQRKGKQQNQSLQNNYYKPYIQYLTIPLCQKIFDYSTDEQIKLNLLNSFELIVGDKESKLGKYVMEEMRNFFTKNPKNLNKLKVMNNHLDFPYFADFLIMFRGKAVTVFLVDQTNEQSKQQSIEHFKKNSNVIVVKSQQDVKKIFKSLTSTDIYN